MKKWLTIALLLFGCSQPAPSSLWDDPALRDLVAQMQLAPYQEQRFATYVKTLDTTRAIVRSAKDSTRTDVLSAMDVEMSKALPILIPKEHVARVQAVLQRGLAQ